MSDLTLVLQLAPKHGPLGTSAIVDIDAPGNGRAPHAQVCIGDDVWYVRHDDLLDFCSAVVGVLQARRPRVSPY